jgi:hypothetical protein
MSTPRITLFAEPVKLLVYQLAFLMILWYVDLASRSDSTAWDEAR